MKLSRLDRQKHRCCFRVLLLSWKKSRNMNFGTHDGTESWNIDYDEVIWSISDHLSVKSRVSKPIKTPVSIYWVSSWPCMSAVHMVSWTNTPLSMRLSLHSRLENMQLQQHLQNRAGALAKSYWSSWTSTILCAAALASCWNSLKAGCKSSSTKLRQSSLFCCSFSRRGCT